MQTLTPNKPVTSAILPEIMELIGGIPEDDLQLFKERLEKRRNTIQRSEYHEAILGRVFPRPGRPVPELPGGKYEGYLITAGKHYRTEGADLAAAQREHKERCEQADKLNHQRPEFPIIVQREYSANETIVPQDDGEALMMLQDPEKFRPLRSDQQTDRIAQLLAEQNALKAGHDAKAREQDAEIARLQVELAEAKKGKNGK
jgi:hypothetical protein